MQVTATAASRPVPPGPPPRKGGLLGRLRYYASFASDAIGFVGGRFDRYGDIYHVADPDGTSLYVLKHPDHLREVLVTRASSWEKKHTAFDRLSMVLGNGLVTSDGEHWKRARRMMQPAFARKRLAGYSAAMVDETRKTLDTWRDGQRFDANHAMMELTLHIVSRTLFSHDVTGDTGSVRAAMATFQSSLGTLDVLPEWMPSPARTRLRRSVEQLDGLVYGLIDGRQSGRVPAPEPPDLLHMLVTAVDEEGDGGGMSEKEVRDELVTLFLAGHETTAQALTWTLYLLSQNPEVERRLHVEVDEVLEGRLPTFDDLPRLSYTKRVLDESMRMYPPVYVVARRAREDTRIGQWAIPAGSEAVAWIYHTHRDPRWYPNPTVFSPDRFTPEAEEARPRQAYAPFGGGPRACIGRQFASIEAQLVLASIATRFRLELDPGQRVEMRPRITLVPKHGMRMILRGRAL